jgi:phosphoglycolate phosphatase
LEHPELILLDLDGTLVDSVPDLAAAVAAMMTNLGLPIRGEAQVREWVGNGMERLVRRALVGRLEGEPDETLFRQAFPLFQESYQRHNGTAARLYPGVRETLERLLAEGYPLGCITNKAHQFTLPLLRALGIEPCFRIVLSGDSLPEKKPHPLPLLHAAQQLGAAPENSLMVGDSVNDVRAARAAGFRIICVSYGYNHGRDIREARPDAVIDTLPELLSRI